VKYLYTYEVSKKKGTELIGTDWSDVEKIIKENCSQFSWSDPVIWRSTSMPTNENNYIVDPKGFKRKSRSNKNYYTLLIDSSKQWEKYPKRSSSLICSYIVPYWKRHLYRVIPFDNSMWGVAEDDDIWTAFQYAKKTYGIGLLDLVRFLDFLNELIPGEPPIPDNNIQDFKKRMKDIGNKLKDMKYLDLYKVLASWNIKQWEDVLGVLFSKFIDKGKPFTDFLEDFIDPIKNDIKLLGYNELNKKEEGYVDTRKSSEIWTDSKCLLVSKKFLSERGMP